MAKDSAKSGPISFDLTDEQMRAIKTIAGNRKVTLAATVIGNKARVDFVACNAAFVATQREKVKK